MLSSTAIHALHVMATYPNPKAINETIKLTSSDGSENDRFGFSVAIDGDTLAIASVLDRDRGPGAISDNRGRGTRSGSVYIFERNSNNNDDWIEVKKLTANDREAEDYFGSGIAIDGDTLLVRALDDNFSIASTYVFERDAGGPNNWGKVTRIFDSGVMAISKDTIVMGSRLDDDNGLNPGSVSIYERNFDGSNNWSYVTNIFASDGAPNKRFGQSAAIENNTIVVGALDSVYIYERDVNNADGWSEIKKLIEYRSENVAISGDTLAISAFESSAYPQVFLFERNLNDILNSWGQVAHLRPDDIHNTVSRFGRSIAIDGNWLVVGAPFDRDKGRYSGSAYLFKRDQSNPARWSWEGKLNAIDGQGDDFFGEDVAISGEVVVIGKPTDNDIGPRSGAAYIFSLSSDSLNRDPPTDTGGLVIAGSANIVGVNIPHPNGNVYNQVLLTGPRASISSDGTRITRISFLDFDDDIVQVEFSGKATVTVTFDTKTFVAAAPPIKYNQPSVNYVKGRATIRVERGFDNFLSIYTVGTINAVNQALFPDGEVYDAMADIALLEIFNSYRFQGIHCANTRFSGYTGKVGIYAPATSISVRVLVGDINASGDANAYLEIGHGSFRVAAPNSGLRITGGDLLQTNKAPIVVGYNPGFDTLISQNNIKSDGTEQPAQRIFASFTTSYDRGLEVPITVEKVTIE